MTAVRTERAAMAVCGTCGDDVARALCRVCGRPGMASVVCLGRVPLANDFRPLGSAPSERHPLHLMHCVPCGLAQLAHGVVPRQLFEDYAYFSSASAPVIEHGAGLRRYVARSLRPGAGTLVVEIGSNDGYLLQGYARLGHRVLGVDPARNIAEVARAKGVPTVEGYFGATLAERLLAEHGPATVIHANNVLAHAPAVLDMLAGCHALLEPDDGRLVIEVPYIKDMISGSHFDTIYHEHVYYFSVTALDRLLTAVGLTAVHVDRLPVHGGSLRIVAAIGPRARGRSVSELLEAEAREGIDSPSYYHGFAEDVHRFLREVRDEWRSLAADGRTLAGYSAPAKAAIMMSETAWPLRFVCDSTPYKQNKLVPGTTIPVVEPSHLMAARPDLCFIFAWNYTDAIVAAHRDYLSAGGVFVTPDNGKLRFIGA